MGFVCLEHLNMTNIVLLCPGQGAQAVGMAKAWCDASPKAKAVVDEADRIFAGSAARPMAAPAEAARSCSIASAAASVSDTACGTCLSGGVKPGHLKRTC